MLPLLLTLSLALPQGPSPELAAVAVAGETELSPAAALQSARAEVDTHLRDVWRQRAERSVLARRPFWLPAPVADRAVERWLHELPTEQLTHVVDRDDRVREHEFGSSYQTTLWVTEDARTAAKLEQRLRSLLPRLVRDTAVRLGGIAAAWTVLVVGLGWLDRLSRGYMTGRLRLLGLTLGVAVPALAFLV
jgi:hypothetical protein